MIPEPLTQLGLPLEAQENWSRNWELSQASFPKEGVFFVQEDFLREVAEISRLRQEARPALFASGRQIRENEPLSRLAWHCHWLAHLATAEERGEVSPYSHDPKANAPLGCTFFSGIIAMAALPRIKAYYTERAIPMSVLSDSALALDIWAEDYFVKHGVWGCDHAAWVLQHTVPTLFRLGRLEFQFGAFRSHGFSFYCNKKNGELAILAPPDMPVADEGYFAQSDQKADFTTTFVVTDTSVTGYQAQANGRLAYAPVTLPLADWEVAFTEGDKMINVHIPACAPLEYELTRDSFRICREFFAKYFPGFAYKGFQCGSWLLDSSFNRFLPPTSNIVRFQSLFQLFPAPKANDWQHRERVFGNPDLPLDQVPQKTSLQKILKREILNGFRFRSGLGLIPR
ncbi:MAG: DUF5596 domain-containing protein [Victivallales bacterium]|nr:DUF5596 domain-containing protein [Victivallales bacterium]